MHRRGGRARSADVRRPPRARRGFAMPASSFTWSSTRASSVLFQPASSSACDSSCSYRRPSSSFIRLRFAASVPSSSRFGTSRCLEKSPDAISARRSSVFWIGPTTDHASTDPRSSASTTLRHARDDEDAPGVRERALVLGDERGRLGLGCTGEPARERPELVRQRLGPGVLELLAPRHGPNFVEGDDPVEDAGNLQVVHADVSEDGGVRLGGAKPRPARVRRGAEPQQGRRDRLVEERPVSSCRCRGFLSTDVDRDVAASP